MEVTYQSCDCRLGIAIICMFLVKGRGRCIQYFQIYNSSWERENEPKMSKNAKIQDLKKSAIAARSSCEDVRER